MLQPEIDFNPIGLVYNFQYCPPGSWAYGFQQRVQSPQGSGDDTALNAIRLYCKTRNGVNTGSVSSYDGLWGDWGGTVYCDTNSQFMVSARFKIEQGCFGDCTSANALQSKCRDFNSGIDGSGYLGANNDGQWGSWRSEDTCPAGTAICGISTRSTPLMQSALNNDNLAMNGAYFICCAIFDCAVDGKKRYGKNVHSRSNMSLILLVVE